MRTRLLTLTVSLLLFTGCGAPTETHTSLDLDFDGTCVRCHAGLHAAGVHPTYKLRCVDCHGGNDQVTDVPENASSDPAIFRSQQLLQASHAQPKSPALARFFFADGIDNDGDGKVDEVEIQDNDLDGKVSAGNLFVDSTGLPELPEIAELGIQGEGVGQFVDSELNRDLNYTRWLNPGDLRVATVSCGAGSRASGEAGGCHQSVIDTVRRSIMASNAAVINGAYYGNMSWRDAFAAARDDVAPAFDPRAGAFGYTFAWDAIDGCVTNADANDTTGRAQPRFDSTCLEAQAGQFDPNAAAGVPGNVALPAFEATQGTIVGSAPGTAPGSTIQHNGVFETRYPWGGKPLGIPEAALPELQPVPDEPFQLNPAIPDPVDTVLRGFRAYYPLNFPGSAENFNFSFGESIEPNIDLLAFNNPYGRGHSSGCTGCHMSYARTGARKPQHVPQLVDGKVVFADVVDPTTKHREFDPATQDIVNIAGTNRLVGITVNFFERLEATEGDITKREQQKYYSQDHKLTTAIDSDTCGACHSFVTRIDHAYEGYAEDEQRDAIARRANIEFTTKSGTQVVIHSSHVREEGPAGARVLIQPDGVDIIKLAIARDAATPGACAPDTFTEDCNNNGELDSGEDLNSNGKLDLIDRVPRERAVDGRQYKYIYGGANGSTRLMDVHFEKGMHCIDCHFLQDTHGDGNIYSTNWDTIEIECEDCHGTLGQRATLFTSGMNGGNDLTLARDKDRLPYFVKAADGTIFQRSRVNPGLSWRVPQVDDVVTPGTLDYNPLARAAMVVPQHMADPVLPGNHTTGSTMENGKLKSAKLECYACHNAWVYNCLSCHVQVNQGDDVRVKMLADGSIDATTVPGENETWYDNKNQFGKTDFQLLAFQRGPLVLGVNGNADGNRLAPFRSSMEAHLTVNDTDGNTLFDNLTFTTWQKQDGNSGRANVATSAVAMNQTMPHTVRRSETKDCDWCHALVDQGGRIRNDHILSQTLGVGTGRYAFTGDWILSAGSNGLELFEIKKEKELKGTSGVSRFPGLIMAIADGAERVAAKVEPLIDGSLGIGAAFDATDVALLRNFNPAPAQAGGTAPPTLTDLALFTMSDGVNGKLVISDITLRGHPESVRPSIGNAASVFVLDIGGPANGLATLSPDVSDPFVYVAAGNAGLATVRLLARPSAAGPAAELVEATGDGSTATAVALAGDVAYTGTAQGTIIVYDLADPSSPTIVGTPLDAGGAVRALEVSGFFLYVATDAGLAVFDIGDPFNPAVPIGAASALVLSGFDARGLYVSAGHAYVAAGTSGVLDVDVIIPAAPTLLGNLVPAGETVDARDVIVSKLPGQTWLLVADAAGAGSLVGIKLDNTLNQRERCLPDPIAAGCGSDLDWRDPTIMGRDPSFDPITGTFDAGDPSSPTFARQTANVAGLPRRFARPALWEKIGTQTGRRLRDSFMPGSGVLSLEVMQRMRGVQLCEVPGSLDFDGNGVGELGLADDAFKASGTCVPFSAQ